MKTYDLACGHRVIIFNETLVWSNSAYCDVCKERQPITGEHNA